MSAVASGLHRVIERLRIQRQHYLHAVNQIDAQFARHGIRIEAECVAKKVGRPRKPARPAGKPLPASAPKRTRKRARYAQTQFVLEYVQNHPGATTGQIGQAWKDAGRKGSANVTLTKLVKTNALARESLAEGRGSSFRLTQEAAAAVPK